MIETNDRKKFGGYIEKGIDKTNEIIEDSNSFLFTFKNNQPNIFYVMDKSKGFVLRDKLNDELFSFGMNDIKVYKQNIHYDSVCYQNDYNFNYNETENALIGRKEFKIKHIQVFQMK